MGMILVRKRRSAGVVMEDEQGDGDGEWDRDGSRHTEDRVAVKPTEKPVDISHRPAGSLEVLVGHHYSRYQPLHIPTTP